MPSVARTRRTSEQIRAEIEQTFGFFPPFYEPALAFPQVLENLWQQTLSAYVDNPLSALFKEKLNALLSRFCTAPYCIIVHSSALRPLGMTAQQVLALLEAPLSSSEAALPLATLPIPAPEEAASPASDSPLEAVLLYCATAVFLERADAPACQTELRRLLGSDLYPNLIAYLAYIKTCHTWIECHPEISYEADQRAVENLGPLLAEEPALADFFHHYQERVKAQGLGKERRRAADEGLRAAQAQTTAILESITDAFMAFDSDWRFTYVNDQSERVMARTREDLLGRCFWDEFPAAVGSTFEREYRRAVDERVAVSFEEFYPPLNIWVEVRAYPSNEGLSVFYQDVTARKFAEEALRRSKEDLRFAIDAARLGTFYCNYPLDKIVWNGTCKQHFFLPPDADVDFNLFYSLLHPDDREPTRRAIEQAMEGGVVYDVEYRTLARDGRTRWVNAVGRFYYGPDGTPTRFDGITNDISARKGAEEEVRRRAERETLLNRVGAAIRHDPNKVLETAVRELGQALLADRCYYASYDQDADTATVGPEWHRDSLPSIAGQYPMSRFAVNRDPVYKAGRTQVVQDTAGDPATQALGLRALVRVPLVSGATMTALSVAMANGPRQWTPEEVSLVEAVATQTQTALEAVRVQRREHAIAQQLQDALQPALPERVHNLSVGKFTRPALDEAQVGGDFFDIFPLDKDLYAIMIGDVSGKGLAAAQQLALIRNSLRTTLYLNREPAMAANSLNRIVTAHDLLVGFVTAFVAVYDAATGQITYCSCGHEPGLIRRAGGVVVALETTGPPLGISESADYGEQTIMLSSGDRLLLYTDGISEAGPSRREMLGTEGLMLLFGSLPIGLGAQAEVEALVGEVSTYTNGIFRDDVAVLLARRE